MDARAIAFPVVWAVMVGAAYSAVIWCRHSSHESAAVGAAARIAASLGLGLLGWGAGLHNVVMLGAMCCGDYRALGPSLGWTVWVVAAGMACVPWVSWILECRGLK